MTKDVAKSSVIAFEQAEFVRRARDPKLRKFDPISAIKIGYKVFSIAKSLGLFGGGSSTQDAINDIYKHINALYQEIQNLHARLDEVREELIGLVLEVEYRNIAADVVGLSQGVGSLTGGDDHSFLDAGFLDSEPNHIRLLERLDENAQSLDLAVIFLNYLDLFIYHASCRVVVVSGAPSLPLTLKETLLIELTEELSKFCSIARDRLFEMFEASYEVKMCGRDIFNDDDGTAFGAQESWGYGRIDTSECLGVTRISIKIGGPAAIAYNDEQRRKAVARVEAEIRRVAREEADAIWNEKYADFVDLES